MNAGPSASPTFRSGTSWATGFTIQELELELDSCSRNADKGPEF